MKNVLVTDFDKTITISQKDFPVPGPINLKAIEVLKRVKESGHYIVLFTMREGNQLDVALDLCKANGLTFDAVNENVEQRLKEWGQLDNPPRKVYGTVYVDDAGCGIKRLINPDTKEKYVDWEYVESFLESEGWFNTIITFKNYKGVK